MFTSNECWRYCSEENATQSLYANMPPEILIKIFQHLEFYDLQAAKLVCKPWFAVSKIQQFDAKGVYKISSCLLDDNHPAADMILAKRIENLHLKSVQYGDVDKLFEHLGTSLKSLTLKLVPIACSMRLTMQYFHNLQILKVCKIKLPTFVENIDRLIAGDMTGLKDLQLLSNDTSVNKYLLSCMLNTHALEKLTIDFIHKDEKDLLRVLKKHSDSLYRLDVRFYEGRSLQTREWVATLQELNLRDLCFQGSFGLEIMKGAVDGKKSLRNVDFAGSVAVGDEFLLMFAEKVPDLERLHLGYCGRITDVGLKHLGKLTNLKTLDITCCNLVTTSGISSAIGSSINLSLQELHLSELDVDEQLICSCAANLPNLKRFNLSGCGKGVTNDSIQEIFEHQRKLEELLLDNCNTLTDLGMLGLTTGASIQNLKYLKRLSLRGCRQLSDVTLICGLKVPRLKYLNIAQCDGITNHGLESLIENCSTIEEMWMSRTKSISHAGIRMLTHRLGRLRVITINNCGDIAQLVSSNWRQSRFRTFPNEVTLRKYPWSS